MELVIWARKDHPPFPSNFKSSSLSFQQKKITVPGTNNKFIVRLQDKPIHQSHSPFPC